MIDQAGLGVNSVRSRLVYWILGWASLFIVLIYIYKDFLPLLPFKVLVFESEEMQNHNPSDKISG